MKNANTAGFTLVELMVAVVITAILLGVGIPSYTSLIEGNSVVTAANGFAGAMSNARSEAIKRGVSIDLVATDGSTAANEFGPGWFIALNSNNATVIRRYPALATGITLNEPSGLTTYTFNSRGYLDDTSDAATLDLCHTSGDHDHQITVSASGGVSIASGVGC